MSETNYFPELTDEIGKQERQLSDFQSIQNIAEDIEMNHGNCSIEKHQCDHYGKYLRIITETLDIDPVRDLLEMDRVNVERASWNNGTIVFELRVSI